MTRVGKRVTKWVIIGSIIWVIGFYLFVDWVVRSGRLIALINENQNDVRVSYDSVTGSLFTDFRFVNLVVDGEDSKVRWKIRIENAVISPSLVRLPRKIFHTPKLHGTGFFFTLDFKENSAPDSDNKVDYLGNFRIQIGDILLSQIKEITIGSISYKNNGETPTLLRSSFRFWPEYELEIDRSRLELENSITDSEFKLDFQFKLARVRFQESPGLSFFRKLSSDLSLQANLKGRGDKKGFRFLNYYFRSSPWLKIEGNQAKLKAKIQVEKGIVMPSSQADFAMKNLKLIMGPFIATGNGLVALRGSKLSVDFQKYLIQPISLIGSKFTFIANTKELDLADPLADLDLFFDLKPTLLNVTALNTWISKSTEISFLKGACEFGAHVKLSTSTHDASGKITLRGRNVVMKAFDSTFETDLNFIAQLKSLDPKAEVLETSNIDISLKEFKLLDRAHQDFTQLANWWGNFKLSDSKFYFRQSQIFSSNLDFVGRDGQPIFITLKNTKVFPFDFSTLSSMRELHVKTQIDITQAESRIKDFTVRSTTLQAQGDLKFKKGVRYGWLNVQHTLKNLKLNFPDRVEKKSSTNAGNKIK